MRIDFATIVGLVVVWLLMTGAIAMGAAPSSFLNGPSMMIVVFGTLAVTMMRFSVKQFIGSVKTASNAFRHKQESVDELIAAIVNMSVVSRKSGFLALENEVVDNETLAKGVQLLVDGLDERMIRRSLLTEINATIERHKVGHRLFQSMGDASPALGMVGTLIGLVQMLGNMSDPKAIGPAMAVALLTTLYGAMIAHMIALPIADKLSLRSREEATKKRIIVEGVVGIHNGDNPRALEDVLRNYLPKKSAEPDAEPEAAA